MCATRQRSTCAIAVCVHPHTMLHGRPRRCRSFGTRRRRSICRAAPRDADRHTTRLRFQPRRRPVPHDRSGSGFARGSAQCDFRRAGQRPRLRPRCRGWRHSRNPCQAPAYRFDMGGLRRAHGTRAWAWPRGRPRRSFTRSHLGRRVCGPTLCQRRCIATPTFTRPAAVRLSWVSRMGARA